MEKQQTDWIADRAGARAETPSSPDPSLDLQRLRQDLQAHRASAGSWESACLKSIADLLEALESARNEQGELNQRLADLHTQLEDEGSRREQLKESVAELERHQEDSSAAEKPRCPGTIVW